MTRATLRAVVLEIAEAMARAGFPRLYSVGINLRIDQDSRTLKTYLSRCLKALRPQRAGAIAIRYAEPQSPADHRSWHAGPVPLPGSGSVSPARACSASIRILTCDRRLLC